MLDNDLPWERSTWLDDVTSWITAQLDHHKRQATSEIQIIHQRPWSAFAQINTNHGMAYFKAPAPAYFHEAALTDALTRFRPACNVPLLATDRIRGWLLSSYAGVTLGEHNPNHQQLRDWDHILPVYIELQMAMCTQTEELVRLGVPDRRLAVFPQLYAQLLEDRESLMIDQENGLSTDDYHQLVELQPEVGRLCQQLAGYGLPETLVHEELHANNVLIHNGKPIFIDWSDSCVGHPFFSLAVMLRSAAYRLKIDDDSAEINRLRDAYLHPWSFYALQPELVEAFQIAYRLGMINRALSWHNGIHRLAPTHKAAYLENVAGWLQDFLHAEMVA